MIVTLSHLLRKPDILAGNTLVKKLAIGSTAGAENIYVGDL
jgi:hypothetical protein